MREWGDETFLVAINSGTAAARIDISIRGVVQDDAAFRVELGKKAMYKTADGMLSGIAIPKRDGIVLRLVN
jgi:hypothetical protein